MKLLFASFFAFALYAPVVSSQCTSNQCIVETLINTTVNIFPAGDFPTGIVGNVAYIAGYLQGLQAAGNTVNSSGSLGSLNVLQLFTDAFEDIIRNAVKLLVNALEDLGSLGSCTVPNAFQIVGWLLGFSNISQLPICVLQDPSIIQLIAGASSIGPSGLLAQASVFNGYVDKVIAISPHAAYAAGSIDGLLSDSAILTNSNLFGQINVSNGAFYGALQAAEGESGFEGGVFNGAGTLAAGITSNEAFIGGHLAGIAVGNLQIAKNETDGSLILLGGAFNVNLNGSPNGFFFGGGILDNDNSLIAGFGPDESFIAGVIAGILEFNL